MENDGLELLISIGIAALVWLTPFLIILGSNKTGGGEKVSWLLAVFFISWFVWIFYFLLAPIKPEKLTKQE